MLTGVCREQPWCADSWNVELLLMLPRRLILDKGMVPSGCMLYVKGQSQLSLTVGILILQTTGLKAFPMIGMLEQSAQVRPVWSGRGSPAGKASVSFPEKLWINEITAFRIHLHEDSGHTVILEH